MPGRPKSAKATCPLPESSDEEDGDVSGETGSPISDGVDLSMKTYEQGSIVDSRLVPRVKGQVSHCLDTFQTFSNRVNRFASFVRARIANAS